MIYGYARVSTSGQARNGNSLEDQKKKLTEAGATEIYEDAYTGTKMDRPHFNELMERLKAGDTLVVTKLDRFARSAGEGALLVKKLCDRGITVNVLNMGIINDTPMGKLTVHIMFAFAEFERDMIVERTQSGKAVAKEKPDFKEGRPRSYDEDQMDHAMNLLKDHSYAQVTKLTGISKSTLIREKNRREAQKIEEE